MSVVSFLAAALRMTTPIALTAMGATVGERAGILNIGLEGMMLVGAFAGAAAAYFTGNPWLGVLAAAAAGMALALFFGVLSISYQADQVVAGVGVNILALGCTTFLLQIIWGNRGASGWLTPLPMWTIPGLAKVPYLGLILGRLNPLTCVCILLVPVLYVAIFETKMGMWLRAVGEHPLAAETVGINVWLIRYCAVAVSGALSGLGGAYLSLGSLNVFTQGMTAGRGFIAFAANIFGKWSPPGVFLASLVFGSTEALQVRLQGYGIPTHFVQMLPYVTTIIVITMGISKTSGPAALGKPYPVRLKTARKNVARVGRGSGSGAKGRN